MCIHFQTHHHSPCLPPLPPAHAQFLLRCPVLAFHCTRALEREKERARDREKERERETVRERETHTHTHRERERERETDRQSARPLTHAPTARADSRAGSDNGGLHDREGRRPTGEARHLERKGSARSGGGQRREDGRVG
eukprot:3935703-Rhodomonas_salina.1